MWETAARISNRLDELTKIVCMVERFGAARDIPRAILNDLNLALDEVLNNIVSHGYPGDDLSGHHGSSNAGITVRLRHDPGLLRAEIEDDGIAFNPLTPRPLNEAVSPRQPKIGGLGIRFVLGLMDEVAYDRTDGRNRLRLTKRIPLSSYHAE